MKFIKSIDNRVNDTILIDWTLGNTCNYECNYCPSGLHNGSEPWISFDKIKLFLDRLKIHYDLLSRRIELQFSGGEPTLYPHFDKLLKYCNDLGIKVQIITNGSRTLNWWSSNIDYLDFVCFSLHYTCHNWNNFKQVVDHCSSKKKVHVNVVMDLENFDLQYSRALDLKKNKMISISLKPIRKDFSSQLYDYTDDQLQLINTFKHVSIPIPNDMVKRGQIYNEKSTDLLNQNILLLNGDNKYLGWHCSGGLEYLVIDQYGDISTSQCRNITFANINDDFIEFPKEKQICQKQSCYCSSDLFLTKESND